MQTLTAIQKRFLLKLRRQDARKPMQERAQAFEDVPLPEQFDALDALDDAGLTSYSADGSVKLSYNGYALAEVLL